MAVGLLWGSFVFLLLMLSLIVASQLRKKENKKSMEPVLLIFMENSEEFCEGVLRQICYQARTGKAWAQIVVIDHYSTDCTAAIVRRLERYYPEIKLLIRGERNTLTSLMLGMLAPKEFQVIDLRDIKDFAK